MTAGVLSGLFLLLLGGGVVMAAPAFAVDDPTRPDARVTYGPSCRPGGLVIEVTAGTAPYYVRLATTRSPGGEDEAAVVAGGTVTLRSADVAWGETIDGRLEYAARDGSGVTFVDELDNYSFTRPTREDCEAVGAPTAPYPSPSPTPAPSPSEGSTDPTTPMPSPTPTDRTPAPAGAPQDADSGGPPAIPQTTVSASAREVAAGDRVTVHGTGFLPGERVVVQLPGGVVLGSATAAADGSVEADIRIPARTETGPTTVALVGDDSAVTGDVALQVAALSLPAATDGPAALVPLVAAAAALVAAVSGLVSVAGRQRHGAARGRSTVQRA